MARADQLLAGMLTAMRSEDELLAALLDGLQGEDSSDEEDKVEEMWIVQDLLTGVCTLGQGCVRWRQGWTRPSQQSSSNDQRSMCA